MNLTVKQGEITAANHLLCQSVLEAVSMLDTVLGTLNTFDDVVIVLEGVPSAQAAGARMVVAKLRNQTAKTHQMELSEEVGKTMTFTWSVRPKS